MINDEFKRNKKLKELLEITKISEEEVEKLSFRDKQKYYKAKSQLGKLSFASKDKNGNGITYKKPLVPNKVLKDIEEVK